MSQSKLKTSYQGLICTDKYVTVHFAVGNGSWLRHQTVKIPVDELLTDQVTSMIDRHVRRRLIEIWSDEKVPDLLDAPWDE